MTVKAQLLQKWKDLYTNGDTELIRKSMPENERVTIENIRVCLRDGKFHNMKLFEAVAKFYKKREKKIEELS